MSELVFLKLGGSLITEKTRARAPRRAIIARLAGEIAAARREKPDLHLILGHGSGSFGHVIAHRYATQDGVHTAAQWSGFAEVWQEARLLNQIVIESLVEAGIPVLGFPPSAGVISHQRKIATWDLTPMRAALAAGLVPLVNGDVAFDTHLGGTIVSTEEAFRFLALQFHPNRILLAGIEPGVWQDFPDCTNIVPSITPGSLVQVHHGLHGSAAVDVTGGMKEKVGEMLALAEAIPGFEALIFSGDVQGQVQAALLGGSPGTQIHL